MGKQTRLSIIIVGALIIIPSLFFLTKNTMYQVKSASVSPTTEPTFIPQAEVTSQTSSDGIKTLNMTTTSLSDGTKNYKVTDGSITITKNSPVVIPFNAWSIDDKYFFLKEENTSPNTFLVYPGEINVTDLFTTKLPNYTLEDITGWASPTLLVVNTANKDGSSGPSFWFDINSKNFIVLSTRFN